LVMETQMNSGNGHAKKSVKMADDVWKDLRVRWVPMAQGRGRDGASNEVYTEPEF